MKELIGAVSVATTWVLMALALTFYFLEPKDESSVGMTCMLFVISLLVTSCFLVSLLAVKRKYVSPGGDKNAVYLV
jgi:hypothetical protein